MKQNKKILKIIQEIFKSVKPHGTVGKFKSVNGKCPGYYVIPGASLEKLLQLKKEVNNGIFRK